MQETIGGDLTPLMKQFFRIKQEYPDALLLFQVGDFYELFFDDAKKAAAFLGIALTKRGKSNGEPIPLCGVPVHALDHYIVKLVRGGFKIAICDQLEEATPGKVVERGVTRVLTPGTLTDSRLLDEKSASYLFSFFPLEHSWGLLFGELLTAQLYATVIPSGEQRLLESELTRFFPDEIILPDSAHSALFQSKFKQMGYFTTLVQTDEEQQKLAQEWMQQQFKTNAVLAQSETMQAALATFYAYVAKNQRQALEQFTSLTFYQPDDFLILDAPTVRNLELIKNNQDGGRKNTLFEVIDHAVTPMGSRMIKKWIMRPLIKQKAIEQRFDSIELLLKNSADMHHLQEALKEIGDCERVIGRIALNRATAQDYHFLMNALTHFPKIKAVVAQHHSVDLLAVIANYLEDFSSLRALLQNALNDDFAKDWLIKKGFNESLDRMRSLIEDATTQIMALEAQEQQKTGINSLKIRYNQVHGYYIEITKANLDSVPDYYKRQQTLVGKERYMIPELQQLQHEITSAKNQVLVLEKELFDSIKSTVHTYINALRKSVYALAHLDALLGLADVAYQNNYVRPQLNTQRRINIHAGRHPVIEQRLQSAFIANDIALDDQQRLLIITGPNMGGKSTYLRQVALIAILAHIGSFVPAQSADIALLDRIFTRIGSGDNLADGKSTFLVEMEETAAICANATNRSLVILDEVGRGTSTFDGLAIAQAVVEYLYTSVGARCLFATHYHELALLQDTYSGIASFYAASKKTKDGILFLYTVVRGIADGSFGIEVAKLAQLPAPIIQRSQEILQTLTLQETMKKSGDALTMQFTDLHMHYEHAKKQLKILEEKLQEKEAQFQQLNSIDYNLLSPKQAFDILWKLKDT